jgi:hypothetical protein
MRSRWRAVLLVSALFAMSASLAPTVAAQKGGPGLFPPGTYRLSFAGADFSGFSNNVQVFLSVGAGSEIARPDGAPQTTTSDAEVFLSLFDYTTGTSTFACLLLSNPSDFSVDNRLGSAALTTTLSPSTPTCFGSPLADTIGIAATWTGVGPLGNSTGVSNYGCAGYRAESSGRALSNTATGTLVLTVDGAVTAFSSSQTGLNSDSFNVEAQGAVDPNCGPIGFGAGPTPAGRFRFFGIFANGFFGSPPGPTNQVSLFDNSQTSQPAGGPTTSSSEFDLEVSFFGGPFNGFGCFAVPSSDVTLNGLVSASVQTTITGTPLCANGFSGYGLNFPMTVNATWTGTGPLMTIHEQNNYQCLGYTQSQVTFVESKGATSSATVTMPDDLGNPVTLPLTGGFGSLTQVDQRIQANGVLQQACEIRG